MRLTAIGLFVIGCTLVMAPSPARACRVVPTFVAPTNLELVAKTPRIVVAKVKRDTGWKVELEVTRVLKGTGVAAGGRLQIVGSVGGYRGPSKPGDLSRGRPRGGSCTPFGYALGRSYLVFLKWSDGGWETVGTPFARVNEEAEPIWLQAVEEYVRVAAIGDPDRRRAALDALVARGAKAGASAADRAIAADVARHLARPARRK